MLVITRKINESLVIGDGVVVSIIEIRGDKVRLGVHAPSEMPVHRREVFDALHRLDAARSPPAHEPPAWRPDLSRG